MSTLSSMAAAAILSLVLANLLRGRGIRAGALLRSRANNPTV
jgi:hypothetical protein